MIEITDINGYRRYLSPDSIASVAEAGVSSQWHGIRSFVRLFDGSTIEARDEANDIAAKVQDANAEARG